MSVFDLDTATSTFDCKIPDCPREARASRGRYAFLCPVHEEEAREAFSASIRAGIARRAAQNGHEETEVETAETPPIEIPPISEVAARIPDLARRVEEKLLHRRAARDEARDSIRALNDAIGELRAAIQALA